MKNYKVFIVIPTIRNLTFLEEWGDEFRNCSGLIVEDHPEKIVASPITFFKQVYHYTWADIHNDFGDNEWIFSRKNAGIRSYGFYKAYQLGADVIITLDDDCFPTGKHFVNQHIDNLQFKAATYWFSTYPDPRFIYTRGFPYRIRDQLQVMVSHGLWSGALDLDGQTEAKLPRLLNEIPYRSIRQIIPQNYFFPMCSMNLAFRREAIPLMYFPLMGYDPAGKPWGYDRFDDIWAGLMVKKICDHLGWAVVNGSPFVEHRKASSISGNVAKEKPGLKVNEVFWQKVVAVKLTNSTSITALQELIAKLDWPKGEYFRKLKLAYEIWISYFA